MKSLLGTGGAKGSRTPDLLNAIQALYQLSYGPFKVLHNVFRVEFPEFGKEMS